MKTIDPALRMALKLQGCLERRRTAPDQPLDESIKVILSYSRLLEQQLQRLHYARQRGWISATAHAREQLIRPFRQLEYSMTEATTQINRISPLPQPRLRDLYDEIGQLGREFSEVELDLKAGVVAAITDDIELKGVFLGGFKMELHLDRLVKLADASAFEVTALDPHPASSNEEVTHPHVRDGEVCAGDATGPIAYALREGRLVDAFLSLNSVLHTYNPRSPFISLDAWDGIPCADCGGVFDSEQSYTCNTCDRNFCDDCARTCDVCDATFCRECLKEDPEIRPNVLPGLPGDL